MGSTIATTSLWGDRLDEYDYSDYGAPVHAPVALDGRWITQIRPQQEDTQATPPVPAHADVSEVLLAHEMLLPNELRGCEIRVVRNDAGTTGPVFMTGTVISHCGTIMRIHDPGHAIATAWTANKLHKHQTAVFELREGFARGVMDYAQAGTFFDNGWNTGAQCTYIYAEQGAFNIGMGTSPLQIHTNPSWARVGPDSSGEYMKVKVLGVWQSTAGQPVAGAGYQWLALEGDVTADCSAGFAKRTNRSNALRCEEWYEIDSPRDRRSGS